MTTITHATNADPIASIPLSQLVPWDGNVRKTGATDGLDELTASIASHGLLQSLVVRKTSGGDYAVVAGRRRFLALSALAEGGTIPADSPVPCRVITRAEDATEISLTENVVRAPMHPADQFEAFRALIDAGSSVADVAARFGMSETAVKQRLRLARISPLVFAAYRGGELTLEQAQAYAVTDDHEAQERVFMELDGDPYVIRKALTEHAIPATDRRARFVTLAAYEAAGGAVQRDLFAEGDRGVFLLDSALLDRLALAKLETEAEAVRAEGWKWVEAVPALDYETRGAFRQRSPEPLPLSEETQAEHKLLTEEYESLHEGSDELDDEGAERLDAIEARIAEIEESAGTAFTPEVFAMAGAFVTIGRQGEPEVLRGMVRLEDEPEADESEREPKARPEFSAALIESLTEARSAGIGAALAGRPNVALAAVVHALAAEVFQYSGETSLQLSIEVTRLKEASRGAQELDLAHERWSERLPDTAEALWQWCLAQPQEMLLGLLAYCAARSLNAVQVKKDRPDSGRFTHAFAMAAALDFRTTDWFTPTAENFFSRVARATTIAAMAEAKTMPAKRSWGKLKKPALAAVAEREIAGTGWLPQPLRA